MINPTDLNAQLGLDFPLLLAMTCSLLLPKVSTATNISLIMNSQAPSIFCLLPESVAVAVATIVAMMML